MPLEIRGIALDVDGTLTNGQFWWGTNGEELKQFSFLDVMGISRAGRRGLHFALISGEDSVLVDRFAEKTKIKTVIRNCKDKARALVEWSEAVGIPLSEIAFMGDDVNDLGAMEIAGFAACPSNAVDLVKARSSYVANRQGGSGAVREVIEVILGEPIE